MKKFYIRINGELMEVDYKVYREYYYGKRKEKYFMFDLKWGRIKQKGGKNKLVREISLESLWEKGIEISTDHQAEIGILPVPAGNLKLSYKQTLHTFQPAHCSFVLFRKIQMPVH